jgi:hypothetical protein
MKLTPAQQAQEFVKACKANGFSWEARSDSVITIRAAFLPGSKDDFVRCDMFAGSVLSHAPLKGGSVWGTDGGSVGGFSALQSGQFVMNKSGESGKRFMAALRKIS